MQSEQLMKGQASEQGKPLVVIADDSEVIRIALRHAMEQDGYEVLEAANGEQCIQICQMRSPDIILLDALMPLMDGFKCCESLQTIM
ncbi:MAG: response regulator, partial [Leptolyngbyaceae cyanobacterium MO_188.B28]|nr:response regulator [Leptolyngbyaceae cyanobacterium MO_188.B28]